jgi:hypothetical protein
MEIKIDPAKAATAVTDSEVQAVTLPANEIIALVVELAAFAEAPSELKVEAFTPLADRLRQVRMAFYSRAGLPSHDSRTRVVHELATEKVDPSDAPTRALFQVIADTLYGGDLELCARSLNALFQPLADSTMTPGQRNGRATAAERVIAGAPGYEVRDDGSLQATQELTDVRAQLARVTREFTDAKRDRDAARGQVRDLTTQLTTTDEQRQAAVRERDIARNAMGRAETEAETARTAASRAQAQLDRVATYRPVIDALNAAEDADRPSRIHDAVLAAQGMIADYREVLDALDAAAPEDRPALVFDAANAAKGDVRKYREALRDIASVLARGGFNNNRVLALLREGTRRVMRAVSEPPARS